ncbi:MAG: alpha-glucan family phosphorylase [Bacteroidales bacterium]|nr:alpha-glucan family phosphorylase [Bacteroidales bacterium]
MMKADYIFETSWEVCNKIGGIYTVISTKANTMVDQYQDNYILIGPDVWKETRANPDFIEDKNLFSDWKQAALQQGLKVRTGRWNIEAKPLVILVDFTQFYAHKNEILAHLWEQYKLDSISGQWDYIEPTIFGYAAGLTIESFYRFYLSTHQEVVAQFHEWMTGTGILYLKEKLPFIATAFTTHATVLGRSIAGNGLPLYEDLHKLNPLKMAERFGVVSKNSLESLSAQQSDVFTTVSAITSTECEQFLGKASDVLTVNGFNNHFVPSGDTFDETRKTARNRVLEIASKLTGTTYPDDTFLILNSGRYEFRNKGIDLFIRTMAELNKDKNLNKKILAVIAVPAGHDGPDDLFTGNQLAEMKGSNHYLTHKLQNTSSDPILNEAVRNKLYNSAEDNVHMIFIPAYLNENDGVVNLDYYHFLPAFDYTVFPSYYEPWGYTPMESIAFGIPTITTTYAGFGTWINQHTQIEHNSIQVLDRKGKTDEDSVRTMAVIIRDYMLDGNRDNTAKEARSISLFLLWENLGENYINAWAQALQVARRRKEAKDTQWMMPETQLIEASSDGNTPNWNRIIVEPVLPDSLKALKELAYNLWWSWDTGATDLFANIDPEQWEVAERNPALLLETLSLEKINRLGSDKQFLNKLNSVYERFHNYINTPVEEKSKIAYFSMEYGLHNSIKTYSGGLGILAGDYLKQASDSNKNMVAIGLMYRQGYFKQIISHLGDQIAEYSIQDVNQLPLNAVKDENGNSMRVALALPGRIVKAKIWRLDVGRIPLYLMDTNINDNNEEDRKLTAQLYGGDSEHRLKQEMLLGLGGIRLLQQLRMEPDIFHINEGHSAFIGLERIKCLIEEEHLTFAAALEYVRATSLFTTHTPVPAGHDSFEEHLIRAYLSHFAEIFSLSWNDFIGLGRFKPKDSNEKFSMSVLATNCSRGVNGVSKIHGRVSREMFKPMYPGYYEEEMHIGYVTNGVHYYTWTDKIWQDLYQQTFDDEFPSHQYDEKHWENIYDISDEKIWEIRKQIKKGLVSYVKERIQHDLTDRQESPRLAIESVKHIHENALIFGFARRFATYKRAHLLFNDLNRLARIVNNHPVIFVFAGKAHPADKAGQDLIKFIIEVSKREEFVGRIIFLENYDMIMGKMLTSGVDVWLNTPTRPLEASGTSGEKAIMNGVINFSVLDGWWAEGYKPDAGWAVTETRTYEDQGLQDQLDAEIIYNTLESEIIPTYFKQDKDGISTEWVSRIKNTISKIAPQFTMQRMLKDYEERFYTTLIENGRIMKEDHYQNTRKLTFWKEKVLEAWDQISVESVSVPDTKKGPVAFGRNFMARITLDLAGLTSEDVGIEIIMGHKTNGDIDKIMEKHSLEPEKTEDNNYVYSCNFPLTNSGKINYAFRMYPKHKLLTTRMDFPLVKWI